MVEPAGAHLSPGSASGFMPVRKTGRRSIHFGQIRLQHAGPRRGESGPQQPQASAILGQSGWGKLICPAQ